MKRAILAVVVAALIVAVAPADDLQLALDVASDAQAAHRRNVGVQVVGWGLAAVGTLIAVDLIQNGDPAVAKPVIAIAGGSALGGLIMGAVNFPKFQATKAGVERADKQVDAAYANHVLAEQAARITHFSEREQRAILNREIFVGMSEAAMLESWGTPVTVNRTVTGSGERKQHVYPQSVYVYTENGVITSWQD